VPTTTAVEFNVDGLPPVPISEVESACREISELIEKFCGGNTRYEIVTKLNPKVKL
jgi:DNA/RNA-binding domain of Phe-tRNA-synthetase-like protein